MAIPQWFRLASPQFIVWLLLLPFIIIALLITGTKGIFGFIRSKIRKTPVDSNDVHNILVSALSLLWFGISILITGKTHYLYNHQKFNSDTWQNPASTDWVPYDITPRQRMIDDLVENVLPGKTKTEVEFLLGAPNNSHSFIDSGQDLMYLLGIEQGFGVDSDWLIIWFDDSGMFERHKIWRD